MHSQKGSALFYILIAVALLAALCYAVAQSGRGSVTQINDERAKLIADDVMQYADAFSNAVAQIRLRGVKDADLCFDDAGWGGANYPNASCSDEANKIFGLKGGGISWRKPPPEALDSTATSDFVWHILGDNEVQGVGTTCGNAACSDLIFEVDGLSLAVCKKINEELHVTDEGVAPPFDTVMGVNRFNGTYTYDQTIGDENAALDGKTAACFEKTASPSLYAFYKVLVAR